MQDWNSRIWIKTNGQRCSVNDLSLLDTLRAIWAMYIMANKHSRYVNLPYTPLGNAIYSRLRTLQSELEFAETSLMLGKVHSG